MIRVTLYQRAGQDEPVLTAIGHSGFSEKGSDIVCSAVSILIYTFADAAERVAGCTVHVDDRDEYRVYIRSCASRDKLAAVTETVLTGLSSLMFQYPEHVQLIIK